MWFFSVFRNRINFEKLIKVDKWAMLLSDLSFIYGVVYNIRRILWIMNGLLFVYLSIFNLFELGEVFGLIHIGTFANFYDNLLKPQYSGLLSNFFLSLSTLIQILVEIIFLSIEPRQEVNRTKLKAFVGLFFYFFLLVFLFILLFYVYLCSSVWFADIGYTAINYYIVSTDSIIIKIDRFF